MTAQPSTALAVRPTTSTALVRSGPRERSNVMNALLAVGGWMGVITIIGAASALTAVSAFMVFGTALLSRV